MCRFIIISPYFYVYTEFFIVKKGFLMLAVTGTHNILIPPWTYCWEVPPFIGLLHPPAALGLLQAFKSSVSKVRPTWVQKLESPLAAISPRAY